MRKAGRITKAALVAAGEAVRPGVTTKDIDRVVHDFIVQAGATPSFLGYGGFPASACVSVNEQVIHGIPSDEIRICEGDLVKIDVGACFGGYHGDCAATFAVGTVSNDAERLLNVTRQSFYEGIRFARKGHRVSDISHAVQAYVEQNGFSVVREYTGHGVGKALHEDPEVRNFGVAGHGPRLLPGMVIAVEPMVNLGVYGVKTLRDGWTVVTKDGKLSAHYENTVLITNGEPEILTFHEGGL